MEGKRFFFKGKESTKLARTIACIYTFLFKNPHELQDGLVDPSMGQDEVSMAFIALVFVFSFLFSPNLVLGCWSTSRILEGSLKLLCLCQV